MNKRELEALIAIEGDFKEFTYKGVVCQIERMEKPMNHLCGYVLGSFNPEQPPYYTREIECHGGITFVDENKIGFDCAHYGDSIPGLVDTGFNCNGEYRTMEFCVAECIKIVDQMLVLVAKKQLGGD